MRLMRGAGGAPPGGSVLTIGSFDGLHVGHQALIARAVALGRETGLPAALLSFEPLPREYFRPQDPPPRLTNFRERWRTLASSELQAFRVLRFNEVLRNYSGPEFMALLRRLCARHVVVGHDFRFAHDGEASAEWCAQQGPRYGFAVHVVAPVRVATERVSSGLVREALAGGDFKRAALLLGRTYTMCGRVQRGAQLGRTLGFPTANLRLRRRRSPLAGIFAVRVRGAGLQGWPAVASLGTRPTVDGVEPLLEAHLFDFNRDLYGVELEVEFIARLRDERRFDTLDALVVQMNADAAAARLCLNASAATPPP
jgi:riboflavin kinase / FMN adenylyltransferase